MCRFVAWLGRPRTLEDLLLAPPFGLLRQSYAPRFQRHGRVNADGFGVGWYDPSRSAPARYRTSRPMWSDESFTSLAGVVRSGCVLAGVRSASIGMPVEDSAVAPFTSGPWLFAHNGFVPDATVLRSLLPPGAVPESRVDSAVLWALVVTRLDAGEGPADALAGVVRDVSSRTTGRLNLFLTDGAAVHACAWGDSLVVRTEPAGVIVASEPSDDEPGWVPVDDGTQICVSDGQFVQTPLRAARSPEGQA